MKRLRRALGVAALCVAGVAGTVDVLHAQTPVDPGTAGKPKVAQAAVNVEVPAGQHRTVRLKALPRGVQIAMAAQSDGPVRLWLMDETDFRRWPSPERAIASVHVERVGSASVGIPVAGDWYLVVDNTQGAEARKLKLVVGAVKGAAGSVAPPLKIEPERREF